MSEPTSNQLTKSHCVIASNTNQKNRDILALLGCNGLVGNGSSTLDRLKEPEAISFKGDDDKFEIAYTDHQHEDGKKINEQISNSYFSRAF